MDFSEKWGTDVDEAVRLALIDLQLSIDEVNVIVLEESSKGFFGLGSKLAKVRVEKKGKPEKKKGAAESEPAATSAKEANELKETTEKEAAELKEAGRKEPHEHRETAKREEKESREERDGGEEGAPAKRAQRQRQRPEKRTERAERPRPERHDAQRQKRHERTEYERPDDLVETDESMALDFIKEITGKMNLDLEIKAMKNDESIYIDIEGKDAGTVIGKRGQTLDAVQYLASLVANKEKEKYLRVVVDAEDYRNKRKRTLELLADRLAGKVVRTRRSVKLEPMNPYERKVIHARLQGNPKISTRSEGEEPYRRVIIEIK